MVDCPALLLNDDVVLLLIVVLGRECSLHDIEHLLSFGCVQGLTRMRLSHPDFFPEQAHCNLRHSSDSDWNMPEHFVSRIGRILRAGLRVLLKVVLVLVVTAVVRMFSAEALGLHRIGLAGKTCCDCAQVSRLVAHLQDLMLVAHSMLAEKSSHHHRHIHSRGATAWPVDSDRCLDLTRRHIDWMAATGIDSRQWYRDLSLSAAARLSVLQRLTWWAISRGTRYASFPIFSTILSAVSDPELDVVGFGESCR